MASLAFIYWWMVVGRSNPSSGDGETAGERGGFGGIRGIGDSGIGETGRVSEGSREFREMGQRGVREGRPFMPSGRFSIHTSGNDI